MEVVAGRTAGRTDIAENIALLHLLPGAHDVGGHMAVARLDRIAMFDLDIIAIAAEALSAADDAVGGRSEEHTSELQSLMRISYAVFCLKKKNIKNTRTT